MSGRLVSAVFDSSLPAWVKPYAAAFASFAADDGSRVFPTRARIARLVSRSERSTQRAIQELRGRGVLELVRGPGGHRAPRYVFRMLALPRTEAVQLPLFPQATATKSHVNAARRGEFSTAVNRFAQLGETPTTPRGDTGVSRSVSDPLRTSTHQVNARARKGKCPKAIAS
jgi:hypothetical protein